jgi:predicted ribosome quality control (RQC) complex YloA/Tae2 family protein
VLWFYWASLATAFVAPPFFTNHHRLPARNIVRLFWEEEIDDRLDMNNMNGEVDNTAGDTDDSNRSILFLDYQRWTASVQTTIQNLEKKRVSLQSELEKAESLEATVARAQLITNNLYLFSSPSIKKMTVQDWENDGQEVELILNPSYESAAAEADALFQQARKLKRGSAVVQALLQETACAQEILQDAQMDLASALSDNDEVNENMFMLVQDRLLRSSKTTNFSPPQTDDSNSQRQTRNPSNKMRKPEMGTPASNVRKIISPYSGCTILVGRNRRGNEYLSFKEARQNDVWLHARGTPGAHVLILQRSPQIVATDECWQLAANLAAFYSDG